MIKVFVNLKSIQIKLVFSSAKHYRLSLKIGENNNYKRVYNFLCTFYEPKNYHIFQKVGQMKINFTYYFKFQVE